MQVTAEEELPTSLVQRGDILKVLYSSAICCAPIVLATAGLQGCLHMSSVSQHFRPTLKSQCFAFR